MIQFNLGQLTIPSTRIENIEINALELSRQLGRGFRLRIDVINNGTRQNCNIFVDNLKINKE